MTAVPDASIQTDWIRTGFAVSEVHAVVPVLATFTWIMASDEWNVVDGLPQLVQCAARGTVTIGVAVGGGVLVGVAANVGVALGVLVTVGVTVGVEVGTVVAVAVTVGEAGMTVGGTGVGVDGIRVGVIPLVLGLMLSNHLINVPSNPPPEFAG